MYKCPVCNEVLIKINKIYKCEKNHSYDISKDGYVNLLLANQKFSKNPGDNFEMIRSRQTFLNKGFYFPLSEKINNIILKNLESSNIVLDLGCGEGYYDRELIKVSKRIKLYGIDMSKAAIISASKYKNIDYCIGSSFNLPYKDNSFDLIFCIFSPYDLNEISRILKPKSLFVLVGPGLNHLKELAEIVYDKAIKHSGNFMLSSEKFIIEDYFQIKYVLNLLNVEDKINLLKMTPYYFSFNKDLSKLNKLENLTIDFEIKIFKLNS